LYNQLYIYKRHYICNISLLLLKNFFYKLTHWEKWPFKLIYFPISFIWAWYILRSRSFWFFTPSNPTITFGGLEGEGKKEMYDQLPKHTYPTTTYIDPKIDFEQALDQIHKAGLGYPFVVKPENGMMGLLFRIIDNEQQLKKYHTLSPFEYIAQGFSDYPVEVSIFYYRHPSQKKGTVSGFIMKEYMQVKGDGKTDLKTLIDNHSKAKLQMEEMEAKHSSNFGKILPKGEVYFLSFAGNHNRGARFINLHKEIDEKIEALCDSLSTEENKFYYGRYDIKCHSIEDLKNQKNFIILEYNGAGAEPNHIYDCGKSLFGAYREILKHWKMLFKISRYNHKLGYKYWPTMKGWHYLKNAQKDMKLLKEKDIELGSI
jgi:hypothetical protein